MKPYLTVKIDKKSKIRFSDITEQLEEFLKQETVTITYFPHSWNQSFIEKAKTLGRILIPTRTRLFIVREEDLHLLPKRLSHTGFEQLRLINFGYSFNTIQKIRKINYFLPEIIPAIENYKKFLLKGHTAWNSLITGCLYPYTMGDQLLSENQINVYQTFITTTFQNRRKEKDLSSWSRHYLRYQTMRWFEKNDKPLISSPIIGMINDHPLELIVNRDVCYYPMGVKLKNCLKNFYSASVRADQELYIEKINSQIYYLNANNSSDRLVIEKNFSKIVQIHGQSNRLIKTSEFETIRKIFSLLKVEKIATSVFNQFLALGYLLIKKSTISELLWDSSYDFTEHFHLIPVSDKEKINKYFKCSGGIEYLNYMFSLYPEMSEEVFLTEDYSLIINEFFHQTVFPFFGESQEALAWKIFNHSQFHSLSQFSYFQFKFICYLFENKKDWLQAAKVAREDSVIRFVYHIGLKAIGKENVHLLFELVPELKSESSFRQQLYQKSFPITVFNDFGLLTDDKLKNALLHLCTYFMVVQSDMTIDKVSSDNFLVLNLIEEIISVNNEAVKEEIEKWDQQTNFVQTFLNFCLNHFKKKS